MKVETKDATIVPTGTDEDFPGTFDVVLSAPTLDRDGDTLLSNEWKMPLPEHVTFDTDHGMSVATTVGSGAPTLNDAGELRVSGTYSSIPRAQELRTLVNEGHIRTVSVAFMTEKSTQKDGKQVSVRELLNGAFTPVPSNREALVLSSKGMKAGARNSASDMKHVQGIHDHAAAMGADCAPAEKSAAHVETKAVVGSLEATQERVRDALQDAYPDKYVWLRATLPTEAVFDLSEIDGPDSETMRQPYTDDGSVVTLTGTATPVDVAEIVTPDPDETAESTATEAVATAEKSAVATATKAAEDAESEAVRTKAADLIAASFV